MISIIKDQTMAYTQKATAINNAVADLHLLQATNRMVLITFSSQRKHTLKSCFKIPTWGFQYTHNILRAAYFRSQNLVKQLEYVKKANHIKGLIDTSEEFGESDIFTHLEKLNKK